MIQESLAHYRILGELGAGGMGEVSRAEDTKLKREVAIKVLPAAFAQDSERMKRLEREAQVLASLNHPNIAAIHGLEESDGQRFLVLELAEGEDLAERLSRGAIPVDEAIQIAKQIAEGLEQAHEKGIIHRDLKPANVKLSREGVVKILDFGLAKALAGDVEEVSSSNASQSPTLARPATVAGVILGTPAYMSPEQARGKTVDRRSDIWAFGLVLYEMLTGRKPFEDETGEPDFDGLPNRTPLSIRRLLRRCLERDPKRRLQAIGEARISLEDALAAEPKDALPGLSLSLWSSRILAVAFAASTAIALWAPWRPDAPSPPVVRTSIELGIDVVLDEAGSPLTFSPDGSILAFLGRKSPGEPRQIYLRRLDQLEATPLSDTEGAHGLFFSPDGKSIGFFAGGKLKRISVTGGAAVALADSQARGGTWTEDGAIVFDQGSRHAGLLRVSALGGPPEVLTKPDPADRMGQLWPLALPGGRGVLITTSTEWGTGVVLQPLPEGQRKVLVQRGSYGRYLPSGHLTYWNEGTVFAVPFDLERLETTGAAVPILEDAASTLAPRYAFSDRGTVVYVSGYVGAHPIEWLDRKSHLSSLHSKRDDYHNLRFSPDGRKLAMAISDGRQQDVWVYDLERETMSRLTVDPSRDENPIWTPNGRRIVFRSHEENRSGAMYWEPADGTGDAQPLIGTERSSNPLSWHPSGRYFAFGSFAQQGDTDQMILPVEGDEPSTFRPGEPVAFLNGPFNERWLTFSPDGAWVAYGSDESGRYEVYVRPFPGPGGKWPISTGGGTTPTWSSNGRELFYESLDRRLMVVTYSVRGDSFEADKPRLWSEVQIADLLGSRAFDLHPDGERFAILRDDESRQTRVMLILNFFDELRRLAPPGKR